MFSLFVIFPHWFGISFFFKQSAMSFETPITEDVMEKLRLQIDEVLQKLPEDLQLILRQTWNSSFKY